MGSSTPSSPSTAAYTKKIDYNMDDDGNRTSVVVTPYQQSAGTTSYTTNSLNQYTAVGGTTQVWDSNGSLTDDGTLLFEYDYKNLPVYVRLKSNNNLVAAYKYDALGRRVEKDLGSNNKQRYVYSGLETIATYNAFDTWKQDFVYAQGIDRIVMLEQADVLDYDSDQNTTEVTRSYYHRNALGSVMEITDASEATVVSYRYDPYGTVTITRGGQTQSTDPLGQHWNFTARFLDEETGLYYYRARNYDPGKGRFLERDALGYSEGPLLYEYASSRPSVLVDPLGLEDEEAEEQAGERELPPYLDAANDVLNVLSFLPIPGNPLFGPSSAIASGLLLGKVGEVYVWAANSLTAQRRKRCCCRIDLMLTAREGDEQVQVGFPSQSSRHNFSEVLHLPKDVGVPWPSPCVFECNKPVRITVQSTTTGQHVPAWVTPTERCGPCEK